MTDFLDFYGKSVEQAIDKACQELHVSKEKLAYDIISYGSTGIFGLVGTKKALIRVFPPEPQNGGEGGGNMAEIIETVGSDNGAAEKTNSAADADKDTRSTINALIDEAFGETREAGEAGEARDISDTGDAGETPVADKAAGSQASSAASPVVTEEALSVAENLLSRILKVLSPEAELSIQRDPDQCRIHISGGDTAILIGRKGQTLEAMQYLVDKALNKQCGKGFRVVIDVEGYLETRRNELTELSARLAEKARRSGKPTTMNLMNAHDRRIVHLALKHNKTVRTQSVGDGYYRKLMILPKRRKHPAKSKGRPRQSQ